VVNASSRAARRRALYPGGHPSAEARAIHRRFVRGPLPRILPIAAVLETRGRVSGKAIRLPLAIVPFHGSWYLASMLEGTSNWVENVRASGGEARLLHGRWREVSLVEVPVSARAPILRRYLAFALSARAHFTVAWRAPIEQFERVAPLHVVFRVCPRAATRPAGR
jgi:hypothetical protein